MIDAGIDWDVRYGAGWIRRFSAAASFGAAASLLHGAANIWQGRYGAGRVVGQSALDLASRMRDLSQHWTDAGTNWTARLLPEGSVGRDSGYVLGKFRDRRRFHLVHETTLLKHPEGARRLVTAALDLGSDKIAVIQASGRSIGDYGKDAERWEDRFEALGETALGVPPDPPLSDEGQEAIERFAVYRACEGLCASAGNVLAFHSSRRDREVARSSDAEAWLDQERRFRNKAREAYIRFAEGPGLPAEETAALLSTRDDASPYLEFAEFHHYGHEDQRGAVLIAALYVSLMLSSIDLVEAQQWSFSMLTRVMKESGLMQLTLAMKALPVADG